MKYLLISLLFMNLACGKSSSNSSVATNPGAPSNPGLNPTPTPTPSPLIGVWEGQDYNGSFQDLVTLNADGTGTQLSCSWTFNWMDSVSNPGNISITNVTSPDRTGDECDPRVFAGPRLIPYMWIINYTTLQMQMFFGTTYTYSKQ